MQTGITDHERNTVNSPQVAEAFQLHSWVSRLTITASPRRESRRRSRPDALAPIAGNSWFQQQPPGAAPLD